MQYTQGQADHLQIFTSSRCRNVTRLCADVVDNRFLQPRDEEVCSLVHDSLFNSPKTVEDDRARAAFDVV